MDIRATGWCQSVNNKKLTCGASRVREVSEVSEWQVNDGGR
jgi:hypothetical protein